MMRSSSTDSINSLNSLSQPLDNGPYVELKPVIKDGNIQFTHKKETYVIKCIKQKIGNNKETTIDLKYFTDFTNLSPDEQKQRGEELAALIEGAQKAIAAMDGLANTPENLTGAHSLKLNFTQEYKEPSLFNTIGSYLGIKRWEFTPEPTNLESISYKESATSEEKTFTVNLERYEKPAQNRIRNELQLLNLAISRAANKSLENLKPLKYKQTEKTLETPSSQNLSKLTPEINTKWEKEEISSDDEMYEMPTLSKSIRKNAPINNKNDEWHEIPLEKTSMSLSNKRPSRNSLQID